MRKSGWSRLQVTRSKSCSSRAGVRANRSRDTVGCNSLNGRSPMRGVRITGTDMFGRESSRTYSRQYETSMVASLVARPGAGSTRRVRRARSAGAPARPRRDWSGASGRVGERTGRVRNGASEGLRHIHRLRCVARRARAGRRRRLTVPDQAAPRRGGARSRCPRDGLMRVCRAALLTGRLWLPALRG